MNLNKSWIDDLNNICQKYLMPVMLVMLFLYNTIVNTWVGGRIETLQNLLAVIIIGIVAVNIIFNHKIILPKWIKSNFIVLVYFVVRSITIVRTDFDYSAIRSVFFECFFLIGITNFTLETGKQNKYFFIFAVLEFIFTLGSLFLYYTMPLFGTEEVLLEFTNLETQGRALLFGNTNAAGIMCAFAVILAVIYYDKNIFNKKIILIYGIYNLIAMILFGCRSANLGLIAAIVALLLVSKIRFITGKKIVVASLICAVLSLAPIYYCIFNLNDYNAYELTDEENIIDDISTGRYLIWKQCAMTQTSNALFGLGSLKLEQEARKELIADIDQDYYWKMVKSTEFGPHNGYIGMISGTGILGFTLFILTLLQMIKRCRNLDYGRWYMLLVFIFMINCFESLFILNRFFSCFFMFMILTGDFSGEKEQSLFRRN